jgi:hypothetical protein
VLKAKTELPEVNEVVVVPSIEDRLAALEDAVFSPKSAAGEVEPKKPKRNWDTPEFRASGQYR